MRKITFVLSECEKKTKKDDEYVLVLDLAKNDIVTLHHEPDSLKLAHITKGKN